MKRKKISCLLWSQFFDAHLYVHSLVKFTLFVQIYRTFATIILESTILRWSRTIKARSTLNSQMVTYLSINRV